MTQRFSLIFVLAVVAVLAANLPVSARNVTSRSSPLFVPAATATNGTAARYAPRLLTFSVSQVIDPSPALPFSVTYDSAKQAVVEDKDGIRTLKLEGAIVDFLLPVSQMNDSLKRSDFGGKEMINAVEMSYDPRNDHTDISFRFAAAGQGKGRGNVGIALATGFGVPGDIVTSLDEARACLAQRRLQAQA